jgi:hypothetical protein
VKNRPKTWKEKVIPVLQRVQPITRVISSAAMVAVHLQKPTILGVTAVVSAAANGLREYISEPPSGGHYISLLCSRTYLLEALRKVGAHFERHEADNGAELVDVRIHGLTFRIGATGMLGMDDQMDPRFIEWIRQILDLELPPVLKVEISSGSSFEEYSSRPGELTVLQSVQGPKILSQTLPMLRGDRRRVILLTGIPGVGKSTMVEEIARKADLGRVIQLDARVIGSERDYSSGKNAPASAPKTTSSGSTSGLEDCLALLSPGVVIVDDIHRIHLSLSQIEALRKAARLVIFTANLPEDDDGETLDGAEIRAARIDEVFPVAAEHTTRRAPFDKLSDEMWDKAKFWPIAFLNDLEVRLLERPEDLRFEDLERRIGLKTRSARGRW